MSDAAIPDSSTYKGGTILGGVLIIGGTCIGAGMLALPVVTSAAGLYPALFISTLCWLFMLCTGLLFLEATLWLKDGANVMSLTGHFLGPIGKIVGVCAFLFLYYCLLVSYIAASAGTSLALFSDINWFPTTGLMIVLITAIFGAVVWLGPMMVDRVNAILMIGLVASFILLIAVGATNVQKALIDRTNWAFTWLAAPILFSAYGYHNVIPSLATYLNRNAKKLTWTIVIGTLVPYITYNLWQWVIIGSIPQLELEAASLNGVPVTDVLSSISESPWLSTTGAFFGLFAIVTSFLGVGLSMVDFLGDALQVRRDGIPRFFLSLAAFVPPAFLAWMYPHAFITAMGIAGGYGEAILNGLIPILMVWIGRYSMKLDSQYKLPGGKATLVLLTCFTVAIMGLETYYLFG